MRKRPTSVPPPTAPARSPPAPVLMNHYDWYEAHNWVAAYPGEVKVYGPANVPDATAGASNDD